MDGQEYLNQIASTVRPVKQSGNKAGFLKSPLVKVAGIGLALLIVIMIVGMALGGSGGGIKEKTTRLLLHINATTEVISEYQPLLKSSSLRSSSASLSSVLSNTSRDLAEYMVAKYDYKENSVEKALTEEATLHKDEIENDLFNAKINGNLDRIYAHKMAYEISLISASESEIYNDSSDESLRNVLNTSYQSLENLYSLFDDFSETK